MCNSRAWRASQPNLSGGVFEWNMTAPYPGLYGVEVKEDGGKMATTVFAVGIGSEVDMQVRTARVDSALPALERQVQY
jgi:hypothetical protein